MTPDEIRKQAELIDKKEELLFRKRVKLQSICGHISLHKKFQLSTGNYDPTADCYWIDYYCPDCAKRWTEEQ